MKVLWLGQGGLLFVSGKKKIMIDPYLTNSLSLIDYTLDRRMKINRKIFGVRPDVMILTNCHPDHADIETVSKFARKQKNKLTILSCESVFLQIADNGFCALANNIMFESGTEWSIEGFNICAVTAKTDDKSAIGVIITDTQTGRKYYVAGDTLYSKHVLSELDNDIYAVFVPINGEYGSMNVIDAKRFAIATKARYAVPVHFGMLDKIDPSLFDLDNAIIPKIYRIIDFESEATQKKQIDRKFNEKPQKIKSGKENNVEADASSKEQDVLYEDAGEDVLCEEVIIEDAIEKATKEAPTTDEAEEIVCEEAVEKEAAIQDEVEEASIVNEDEEAVYEEDTIEEAKEAVFEQATIEEEAEETVYESTEEYTSFDYDSSVPYNEPSVAIEGGYDEDDFSADSSLESEVDEPIATYENEPENIESETPKEAEQDKGDDPYANDFNDFDDFDDDYDEYDEQDKLEFEPFTADDLLAFSENSESEGAAENDSNAIGPKEDTELEEDTKEDIEAKEGTEAEESMELEEEVELNEEATENIEQSEDSDNENGEEYSAPYTPKESSEQDDADLIDAFVKELEKLDRGETPDFSK